MTLVILGHDFKPDPFGWPTDTQSSKQTNLTPLVSNGIFAVADSSITAPGSDGEVTILGGFKKIYSIPYKVWKPYFIEEQFHSYRTVLHESSCLVAIAGSTLTAQHVLNSITEHLEKVRISYKHEVDSHYPRRPVLIRHCEINDLESGMWDEEMFYPEKYEGVVSADAIAKIVHYSINEALKTARKYKLDEKSLKAMYTEFALGIYCPKTKSHKLYVYRMTSQIVLNYMEVFTNQEEITEGKIAVLGMKKRFETKAQSLLDNLLSSDQLVGEQFFQFLNSAIDSVRSEGNYSIDRPSYYQNLFEGKVTLKGKAKDQEFSQ